VCIADYGNHRIRKVTVSTGIITLIAGSGGVIYNGDGGQATAANIYFPYGVALDSSGTYQSLIVDLLSSFNPPPR